MRRLFGRDKPKIAKVIPVTREVATGLASGYSEVCLADAQLLYVINMYTRRMDIMLPNINLLLNVLVLERSIRGMSVVGP